jgi:hypothetical protein
MEGPYFYLKKNENRVPVATNIINNMADETNFP